MEEHVLVGIVTVIALGVGAQWLAWRIRMPSILLLLLVGFVAGPVTRFLDPATLQGDWVFAFVSISIGIILFEGGLSLRVSDLREVGRAVFNLITIGVLATWILAGAAAYFIAGFNLSLAFVVGAVLTVTGPTVVVPILRHVRPSGRIGTIAKWEGITIDPVGAVLAVLVVEVVLLLRGAEGEAVSTALLGALEGLLSVFFISVGVSISAAALIVLLLYRRLVPDYMSNSVALAILVVAFALSNVLKAESGLMTATLMGVFLANQPYASVRRIVEFKEDLQVLLIASLFILLSARLELDALEYIDVRAGLFLAALILIIRPAAVWIASLGTTLEWREKAFLAWLAPRGIVAAAVAALFALRLEEFYPTQAPRIVPVVFLIIVGTVAVYGLTIAPLARWLGLAQPNPQGVVFLGAHAWSRRLAKAVSNLGFKVLVVDANIENVNLARLQGVPAQRADALSESAVDELDLSGIGKFLALTPNGEVNALAALNFREVFESSDIYQLASEESRSGDGQGQLPQHLRGLALFGPGVTHQSVTKHFNDGGEVRTLELTEELSFEDLGKRYDEEVLPLFAKRGEELLVISQRDRFVPREGDQIVALLPPPRTRLKPDDESLFADTLDRATVLDLREAQPFSDIARHAARLLAERIPVSAERLATGFLEGARYGATLVSNGSALPHYRLSNLRRPEMVLVRCASGVKIKFDEVHVVGNDQTHEGDYERVFALFFLVSPEENPGQHLRILSHIANRIDDVDFMPAWKTAGTENELRTALLVEEEP